MARPCAFVYVNIDHVVMTHTQKHFKHLAVWHDQPCMTHNHKMWPVHVYSQQGKICVEQIVLNKLWLEEKKSLLRRREMIKLKKTLLRRGLIT